MLKRLIQEAGMTCILHRMYKTWTQFIIYEIHKSRLTVNMTNITPNIAPYRVKYTEYYITGDMNMNTNSGYGMKYRPTCSYCTYQT